MSIEAKLTELGIELPPPPPAVAAYEPWMRTGNLVITSGQLPWREVVEPASALARNGSNLTWFEILQMGRYAAAARRHTELGSIYYADGGPPQSEVGELATLVQSDLANSLDALGLQPVGNILAPACWRAFPASVVCGAAGPFWGPAEISLAKTTVDAQTEGVAE